MFTFTSPKEKRLWLCAGLVMVAIAFTLMPAIPFAQVLQDQNIQAVLFLAGMLLVALMTILYGFSKPTGFRQSAVTLLGMLAAYVLLFLRLGLAERSHLIEYAVLSIFIHRALEERSNNGKGPAKTRWIAFLLALTISLLDEGIQYFVPHRIFDLNDIIFNSMVIVRV